MYYPTMTTEELLSDCAARPPEAPREQALVEQLALALNKLDAVEQALDDLRTAP